MSLSPWMPTSIILRPSSVLANLIACGTFGRSGWFLRLACNTTTASPLSRALRQVTLTESHPKKRAADKMSDGESVGFGDSENMIRGDQAARARHIFHDDTGIARNVSAQVARNGAGVSIKAAAGGKADDDANVFAFVEIIRGGALSGARQTYDGDECVKNP